ncbi:hypothetical protein AB0I35_15270 [Nocardia sp. NPDC050378]|uniref:hypothetical protein n=1 Tax=Nocardia sp. NPDC050378 TaxID=3155400 RepID=UPI0033CF2662
MIGSQDFVSDVQDRSEFSHGGVEIALLCAEVGESGAQGEGVGVAGAVDPGAVVDHVFVVADGAGDVVVSSSHQPRWKRTARGKGPSTSRLAVSRSRSAATAASAFPVFRRVGGKQQLGFAGAVMAFWNYKQGNHDQALAECRTPSSKTG